MRRCTVVMCLAAAALVVALCVGQSIAQAAAPPPGQERARQGRGQRSPEQWRQRMEEFRQRMADRMREQLGASEEEWKVLQPRIEKIMQLQRQSRAGPRGMFSMFSRGRRGGGADRQPGGTSEREPSEVEKKTEALQSLLDDEASSAASIKAALDALRKARRKTQDELALARKELRDVCSMKQEARFVLIGLLD